MSDITRPGRKPGARICVFANEIKAQHQAGGAVWWSQTGSNRRPPACKAGALPTELWPRASGVLVSGLLACRAAAPGGSHRRLRLRYGAAAFTRCASEGWWAWEDLNFRPHAYQARALTN